MAVSLSKTSNRVSLRKNDGTKLKQVIVGLHWLGKKQQKKTGFFGGLANALSGGASGNIDLDASVVAFDSMGNIVDTVWFREPRGYGTNGAIKHLGDNRTGGTENVSVNLEAMPKSVKSLYFVINSFTGQKFNEIAEARCEITEQNTGEVAISQSLTDISGSHTALVLCKFLREGDEWTANHIGYVCNGTTVNDLISVILNNRL